MLFDNGAGNSNVGWPYPGFEKSFSSFPIPGTEARSWYLAPGGALADQSAAAPAADRFTWDAHARPPTDFTGDTASGPGGLWTATPNYQWTQDPAGTAVSYVTAPLSQDTAVIGAGRVDLWVRSSTPNVDLQASISEVRPDGKETFVQNGWIKTKARKLDDAKSTELEPVPSFRQEDFQDMPSDQFVPVTIPLYYEGHMYRDGVPDPGEDLCPQRRSADLGVQRGGPRRPGERGDRLRGIDAVTAAAAGHPGSERAHRASALPGPAGRAVPRLPALRQPGGVAGQGAALHLARHSGAANPSVT